MPMNSNRNFPAPAFAALLLDGMTIGFAGIFMRVSDVNPIASAIWRMALAALLLSGISLSKRGR